MLGKVQQDVIATNMFTDWRSLISSQHTQFMSGGSLWILCPMCPLPSWATVPVTPALGSVGAQLNEVISQRPGWSWEANTCDILTPDSWHMSLEKAQEDRLQRPTPPPPPPPNTQGPRNWDAATQLGPTLSPFFVFNYSCNTVMGSLSPLLSLLRRIGAQIRITNLSTSPVYLKRTFPGVRKAVRKGKEMSDTKQVDISSFHQVTLNGGFINHCLGASGW